MAPTPRWLISLSSDAGRPRPPFDPEIRSQIGFALDADATPIGPETIAALRSAPAPEQELISAGVRRSDVRLTGWDDVALAASVLEMPAVGGETSSARPGIVFFHPGGMVAGNRWSGVPELLDLVQRFNAVIVTVDYKLAPENPHPAPVEDCYAALQWTAEHIAELGIDPDRLLVAGASAGGGLAAAVALLARDRGGPALCGQLLICPMLDDRAATVSSAQFERIGVWNGQDNRFGWDALLGPHRGAAEVSPYAAPARATDLSGLPPAFIDCGSAEVFRDEDVTYASRIWASGGDAELHVWPGGFHGFDSAVPEAALSRRAREARVGWLARILAQNTVE